MSVTQFGNLRQRWSRSSSGLQSHIMNVSVDTGTSGSPSRRLVEHLSRTLVSPIPSFFATVRTASLNSSRACTSSLGTFPVRYTYAHTSSTWRSVSGMMELELGGGPPTLSDDLLPMLDLPIYSGFLSSRSSI